MTDNINTLDHWNDLWIQNSAVYPLDVCHIVRFKFVAHLCTFSQRVLDVASGPGFLAPYLPAVVIYERLDFCESALKSKPGKYYVADLLNIDSLPGSWDIVVAMEILEHVDDPARIITLCAGAATHQAIFTVPNDRLGPDQCPEHVRKYTVDSFRDLFYKLGFAGKFTIYVLEGSLICRVQI